MLCERLDGQRAQLHVQQGRAVACFSRRALDRLEHPGMARLREIAWPARQQPFDFEVGNHAERHAAAPPVSRPAMYILSFERSSMSRVFAEAKPVP